MAISTFSVFVPTSSEIQSVASDKISLTSLLNLFRGKDNHFSVNYHPSYVKLYITGDPLSLRQKSNQKCIESEK